MFEGLGRRMKEGIVDGRDGEEVRRTVKLEENNKE